MLPSSDSDSEEEDGISSRILLDTVQMLESEIRGHGGSAPGKAPNRFRGMRLGHTRIMQDYFVDKTFLRPDGQRGPVFSEEEFERRFRMPRRVWRRLFDEVLSSNSYFEQKPDATGLLGASPEQKMVAAIR